MLTIKNRSWLFLLLIVLSACAPPGPRAFLKGQKHLEAGRYDKAVPELELATSILRTNASAWNYLGLAYHESGRPADALKAYLRALQIDRALAEARYNLGCLYLDMNRWDEARGAFTTFTLEREQVPEGYLNLGLACSKLGDVAGAEKAYQRALKLSPENPAALTGLGVLRQKRGRSNEAVEFFNRALKAVPQYGPALLNYGLVAQQSLKERPLALKLFQQYLALRPQSTNAAAVMSLVLQLQREMAGLGQPVKNVSPVAPAGATNTPAFVAQRAPVEPATKPLAQVQKATTLPAAATIRATKPGDTAITQPPPAPIQASERDRKISAPALSPSGSIPKAPEVSARPAVLQPPKTYSYANPAKPAQGNRTEAGSLFAKALAARQQHRLTDAVKWYRRAVDVDASFFNAHYNLALVLTDLGDTRGAARAYEGALAAKPDSVDARYNFALLLKDLGFISDSISELQRILAQKPDDARADIALGNVYSQQLQQTAKAREYYTKALEADPGNPQAAAIRRWLADPRN